MKINIDLDWDYLYKLPTKEFNEFTEKYLKFATKTIIAMEKDYLKKKGLLKKRLTSEEDRKMENALRQRKAYKKLGENILRLNKPFYFLTKGVKKRLDDNLH